MKISDNKAFDDVNVRKLFEDDYYNFTELAESTAAKYANKSTALLELLNNGGERQLG